jgi:hypothetical protein
MFIELKNGGKSPATVKEFGVQITHGPLPPVPIYGQGIKIGFPAVIPGTPTTRTVRFEMNRKQQTIDDLKSSTLKFFIYGFFRYSDDFGFWPFGDRQTGFCFQYVPTITDKTIFETCIEPAYTYAN